VWQEEKSCPTNVVTPLGFEFTPAVSIRTLLNGLINLLSSRVAAVVMANRYQALADIEFVREDTTSYSFRA
jgi:hypothetical protein